MGSKEAASDTLMNILVTIDEGYVRPFTVLAKSAVVNNPDYEITFILVHSSIRASVVRELQAYCKKIGSTLLPAAIDEERLLEAPATKRYPREVYYRLLAPHVLPESIERVIYLDCDMLVIGSLAPLWEIDLHGMAYAAASHSGENGLVNRMNQLRLNTTHEYFNTGVLLMDLNRARELITAEGLIECTEALGRRIVLPDQDVFNVICGECCIPIDEELWNYDAYNYVRYLTASHGEHDVDWVMENASILHFCWPHKPWKVPYAGRFGSLYKHYLQLAERCWEDLEDGLAGPIADDSSDKDLISDYAKTFGMTASEFMRMAALDRIEDELDLKAWHKAKTEYDDNPISYSAEEVVKKHFRCAV